MSGKLIVKDVDFNGAILKAGQDKDGTIWVGIRWVCLGMGLSTGQMQRQIANIRNDLFLSEGAADVSLPTAGGLQKVLCLKLDYLPIWLATIPVTPTMRTERPDLVENLKQYKLRAKDVLAEAFLKRGGPMTAQTLQLQVPTYGVYFEELEQKIDGMMHKIDNLTKLLNGKQVYNQPVLQDASPSIPVNTKTTWGEWKTKICAQLDVIVKNNSVYDNSKSVLVDIYNYMRRNYGIVWDQAIKEYKEQYQLTSTPSVLNTIYNNEAYRSIFEAILKDRMGDSQVASLDDVIRPLARKYGDTAPNGCWIYKKVYKMMSQNHGIDWTKYENEKCTKKECVKKYPVLENAFKLTVKELLA